MRRKKVIKCNADEDLKLEHLQMNEYRSLKAINPKQARRKEKECVTGYANALNENEVCDVVRNKLDVKHRAQQEVVNA